MRFNRYVESPYKQVYITVAKWCNQPQFFKQLSFREFIKKDDERTKIVGASMRGFLLIEKDIPDLIDKYYDLKFHTE